MTDTTDQADLVSFVRARLDEDGAAVETTRVGGWLPSRWTSHRVGDGDWAEIRQTWIPIGAAPGSDDGTETVGLMLWGRNEDQFVTRFDPHRAASQVAASRAILDRAIAAGEMAAMKVGYDPLLRLEKSLARVTAPELERVVRILASMWSDHPDYRQEWAL